MTPQEFYDNLMEAIHQFPLDANHYDRQSRRTGIAFNRYLRKFKKIINGIDSAESKKFIKIKRKLYDLLDRKKSQVAAFESCIDKHLATVEEYCRTTDEVIIFTTLQETKSSVIKIEDELVSSRKFCACNEKAGGMMIKCENPDCPIKWYHFKCVGLNSSPRVEWMCMSCRKDMGVL